MKVRQDKRLNEDIQRIDDSLKALYSMGFIGIVLEEESKITLNDDEFEAIEKVIAIFDNRQFIGKEMH